MNYEVFNLLLSFSDSPYDIQRHCTAARGPSIPDICLRRDDFRGFGVDRRGWR